MAKVFGETSTTDEVLSGVNLKGKRVLVTGVSSGLGVETARSLAAHGAQVVGAARELKKAAAATDQVRKDAATNGGSFEVIALDLASLASVRECADALFKKGEPFDVIIANAGVMATPIRSYRRWIRNAVRHESPRPLRTGEQDCAASSTRRTADQSRIRGAPLRQRRSSRPQLRAHSLRPMGCLRTLEDSQHPFCGCVRRAPSRPRDSRRRRPSWRYPNRACSASRPGSVASDDRSNQHAIRGRGRTAFQVQDDPSRSSHVCLGRLCCLCRRDRGTLLRELSRQPDRSG